MHFSGTLIALFGAVLLFLSSSVRARQSAVAEALTPKFSQCPPGTSLVRSAGTTVQTLGPDEERYITTRKQEILPNAWKSYLHNLQKKASSLDVELPDYISCLLNLPNLTPTLGIAISGGGYKAAAFGAANLEVLDSRNGSSVKFGTGGLLQSTSYVTGLSGSSWLLTSLIQANFPTFEELVFGPKSHGSKNVKESAPIYPGWLGKFNLFLFNDANLTTQFAEEIVEELRGKFEAGFPVTLADTFGRTLARHFVNGTTDENFFDPNALHGAGITMSSLASLYVI